jgi:prepilin-type N-terminal cleavage/methylation domain-containing protein
MLARLHKRMNKEEEGFTLIELLVVIIIIGILAAIAIPVFLSQRSKGYEASMKSDLRTAAQEVESQNVDNQNYLSTTFGTGTLTAGTSAVTGTNQTVGTNTNVTLSPGNTITWVAASSTAYCLKATSSKTTAVWYYSSDKGGVLAAGATCSTSSI